MPKKDDRIFDNLFAEAQRAWAAEEKIRAERIFGPEAPPAEVEIVATAVVKAGEKSLEQKRLEFARRLVEEGRLSEFVDSRRTTHRSYCRIGGQCGELEPAEISGEG